MDWYCIYTKPKREQRAIEQVGALLGYEVYFPKITRKRTIQRVRREVSSPLFPRYFFCRFEIGIGYRAVRYAHDVLDIVSFGGVPMSVANDLIEQLKTWEASERAAVQVGFAFTPGERVSVLGGPMRGVEATILEDKNEDERVAILLWILGCGARLNVDRCDLIKIA